MIFSGIGRPHAVNQARLIQRVGEYQIVFLQLRPAGRNSAATASLVATFAVATELSSVSMVPV